MIDNLFEMASTAVAVQSTLVQPASAPRPKKVQLKSPLSANERCININESNSSAQAGDADGIIAGEKEIVQSQTQQTHLSQSHSHQPSQAAQNLKALASIQSQSSTLRSQFYTQRHHRTTVIKQRQSDQELIQSCDRLFLEEFEDLNRHHNMAKEADKKLSYSQDICGKKGFQHQKQINMDKIMKMNRRKRQLVTHTIAESSRIQTKKFFVRENIKKQLLKEREEKLFDKRTSRNRVKQNTDTTSPLNSRRQQSNSQKSFINQARSASHEREQTISLQRAQLASNSSNYRVQLGACEQQSMRFLAASPPLEQNQKMQQQATEIGGGTLSPIHSQLPSQNLIYTEQNQYVNYCNNATSKMLQQRAADPPQSLNVSNFQVSQSATSNKSKKINRHRNHPSSLQDKTSHRQRQQKLWMHPSSPAISTTQSNYKKLHQQQSQQWQNRSSNSGSQHHNFAIYEQFSRFTNAGQIPGPNQSSYVTAPFMPQHLTHCSGGPPSSPPIASDMISGFHAQQSKRVAFQMDTSQQNINDTSLDYKQSKNLSKRIQIKSSQETFGDEIQSRLALNQIQRNVISSPNSSCQQHIVARTASDDERQNKQQLLSQGLTKSSMKKHAGSQNDSCTIDIQSTIKPSLKSSQPTIGLQKNHPHQMQQHQAALQLYQQNSLEASTNTESYQIHKNNQGGYAHFSQTNVLQSSELGLMTGGGSTAMLVKQDVSPGNIRNCRKTSQVTMQLQEKLSPKKYSEKALVSAYTPSNRNFKSSVQQRDWPKDLSDKEKVQLQKYRLLNYSPPVKMAADINGSNHQSVVCTSMERRRSSAAVMKVNRSDLQHQLYHAATKNSSRLASKKVCKEQGRLPAGNKAVALSRVENTRRRLNKNSDQRKQPAGQVHLTNSQFNQRKTLARDILAQHQKLHVAAADQSQYTQMLSIAQS